MLLKVGVDDAKTAERGMLRESSSFTCISAFFGGTVEPVFLLLVSCDDGNVETFVLSLRQGHFSLPFHLSVCSLVVY